MWQPLHNMWAFTTLWAIKLCYRIFSTNNLSLRLKPRSTSACAFNNVKTILTIIGKFFNRKVSFKYLIKSSSNLAFDLSNSWKYILFSFTTVYRHVFFSASLATVDVITVAINTLLWHTTKGFFNIHQAFQPYLLGLRTFYITENKKSLKLRGCKVRVQSFFASILNACNLGSVIFSFCFNARNSWFMEKTKL